MVCQLDSDCERLHECIENTCKHISVFTPEPIQIFTNIIFCFFVGFATCGNFGSGAIQVVLLMGLLNYSRKESAGMSQALLVGICFGSWVRSLAQRHPLKVHSSIIDYKLSALLLPCLFAGLLGGIHLRNYLPGLVLSIFLIIQILLLLTKTLMKYRSVKALEQVHEKVIKEIQEPDQPQLITQESLGQDSETLHIDFNIIFKLISKSPHKDLYVKYLSKELQEMSFTDIDTKQVVKVKEYLLEEYDLGSDKIYTFQQQHEDEILQNKVADTHESFVGRDTIMAYYTYGPPVSEISLMIILALLNLLNLWLLGGKHIKSLVNVTPCSLEYWLLFTSQFVLNVVFYLIATYILKRKSDHEYSQACIQYNEIIEKTPLKPISNQNHSRIEIPITLKAIPVIFLVGLSGGFLMGFIGVGASLLMVLILAKLRTNMQSLMATLPLLIAFSCLLGTLIQLLSGYLEWNAALLYSVLCFLGSTLINPVIAKFLEKIRLTSTVIRIALFFQICLLCLYLIIWIPTINYDSIRERVTTTAIC